MKYWLSLFVMLGTFATQVRAEDVIVKAAKVYPGAGAVLSPGMVHVKDGKIVAIAKEISPPANAKIVDLGKGTLMPGLIDAFTSIGVEGGAAEATNEITPSFRVVDAIDWSARAFREARSEGTTTVAIVPGTDNVISGLSCIAKTAGTKAQRLVTPEHSLIVTLASDPTSGNASRNRPDSIYTRQPTNRMGIVWMLRSAFDQAKGNGNGNGKDGKVLRDALAGTRPVICVSRSDSDVSAALRLRKDYPVSLTIAGCQEAYKARTELTGAKVPLLLGSLNTRGGVGPESTETIYNLAGTVHEAGLPFALTGGNLLEQAQFAVRFGLPPEAAIAAITATPAKLLGQEPRLGSIAAGCDADLVALTGDPFDLTSRISWTMIDGVIHGEEPKP